MHPLSTTSLNPGHAIRRSNRSNIMNLLYRKGGMLRSDICTELNLTGAAVSRITRELIDAGLVSEGEPRVQKGIIGRRSSELTINPDGAFVLALTITANRKSAALFNAARKNLGMVELSGENHGSSEQIIDLLASKARILLRESGVKQERLAGIGLGIATKATDINQTRDTITSQVLGWKDVPVAAMIQQSIPHRLAIEARAPALLRAEVGQHSPYDRRNLFLINVGLGVGTAGFFDSEILSGTKFGFGAISHITHPESDVSCECGRKGCLEHSAAGPAVVVDIMPEKVRDRKAFPELAPLLSEALQRAAANDKAARDAFFSAGQKMATGVDTAFTMMNPDQIILAGETGRQKDYIAGIKQGLKELGSPLSDEKLIVSTATSAEASAAIALDAFVYSEQLNVERLRAA